MATNESNYELLNTPTDVIAAAKAGKRIDVRCTYSETFGPALFTGLDDFDYIDWNMRSCHAEYRAVGGAR